MANKSLWPYCYPEFFYVQNFNHYEMNFHSHQRLEIMLVVTGSCHVSISDNQNYVDCNLKCGDYVVIAPNVSHLLNVKKGTQCRLICVEFGKYPSELNQIEMNNLEMISNLEGFGRFIDELPPYVFLKDHDNLCHTLLHLIQEKSVNVRTLDNSILLNTLTTQIMTLIGRHYCTSSTNHNSLDYVKKAITFLNAHFEEEIQLEQVAHDIGISLAYLQRLFRQHVNATMTDYVIDKRLEKAKILLSNTNIPVIDICFLVGFNHRQYFTKQFTTRIGLSPKQYRMSHLSDSSLNEVNRFRF